MPPARKSYPRSKPAIAPWTDIIDAWLEGDESVPRKQRHTARRIWQRLGAEHDASLSGVTVSRYVRNWWREHGKTGVEVVVPQTHEPGAEAEVDFGECHRKDRVMTTAQRRRRGLSAQAADTAVDQACRQLRLPTVRGLFGEMVTTAEKEQLTYQGFLAELLLAECDDR